jgi:hypothetical protein
VCSGKDFTWKCLEGSRFCRVVKKGKTGSKAETGSLYMIAVYGVVAEESSIIGLLELKLYL